MIRTVRQRDHVRAHRQMSESIKRPCRPSRNAPYRCLVGRSGNLSHQDQHSATNVRRPYGNPRVPEPTRAILTRMRRSVPPATADLGCAPCGSNCAGHRWYPLGATGHWYTSADATIGGIPVCSPARTLLIGNGWDRTGTVGNR